MKKIFVMLSIALASVLQSANAQPSWYKITKLPEGGAVLDMASDYSNKIYIQSSYTSDIYYTTDNGNTWEIAPNPATDRLTIKSKNKVGTVLIYNIVGELIKEAAISQNATINISDLSKGIYFVRTTNYPQQVLKFIKQ